MTSSASPMWCPPSLLRTPLQTLLMLQRHNNNWPEYIGSIFHSNQRSLLVRAIRLVLGFHTIGSLTIPKTGIKSVYRINSNTRSSTGAKGDEVITFQTEDSLTIPNTGIKNVSRFQCLTRLKHWGRVGLTVYKGPCIRIRAGVPWQALSGKEWANPHTNFDNTMEAIYALYEATS